MDQLERLPRARSRDSHFSSLETGAILKPSVAAGGIDGEMVVEA